jgi:hypothetical protein
VDDSAGEASNVKPIGSLANRGAASHPGVARFTCRRHSDGVKLHRVNQLYYGDNLQVLREHLKDESVDRLMLDQRAEHPDHAPDLNFKKAKTESNAAQKDLI